MTRHPVITIDGPVGSGKTTLGRALAERLGYVCIDSGLFYRAAAWAVLRRGGDPTAVDDAVEAVGSLDLEFRADPAGDHAARVLQGKAEITDELYTPAVERIVSQVSQIPGVRRALLPTQRAAIEPGRVVVVGRDIGTVVWPQAELKLYLDASLQTRVERKWLQRSDAGETTTPDEVRSLLENRDRIDSSRSAAPLQPAPDAVRLTSDHLSPAELVARIESLLRERSLVEAG
jgi:cytidylate kinase